MAGVIALCVGRDSRRLHTDSVTPSNDRTSSGRSAAQTPPRSRSRQAPANRPAAYGRSGRRIANRRLRRGRRRPWRYRRRRPRPLRGNRVGKRWSVRRVAQRGRSVHRTARHAGRRRPGPLPAARRDGERASGAAFRWRGAFGRSCSRRRERAPGARGPLDGSPQNRCTANWCTAEWRTAIWRAPNWLGPGSARGSHRLRQSHRRPSAHGWRPIRWSTRLAGLRWPGPARTARRTFPTAPRDPRGRRHSQHRGAGTARLARGRRTRTTRTRRAEAHLAQHRREQPDPERHPIPQPAFSPARRDRCGAAGDAGAGIAAQGAAGEQRGNGRQGAPDA